MFQHFLRYVREENWLLFLNHLRRRTYARNFGTSLDRGRIRFSIEPQDMQTFSAGVQDVEVRSMDLTSAGQNVTQAVQDSLDRGLIGHGAGGIQQSSISLFSAPHNASTCCAHDVRIIKLPHVASVIRVTTSAIVAITPLGGGSYPLQSATRSCPTIFSGDAREHSTATPEVPL